MVGFRELEQLVKDEITQKKEEGCEVSEIENKFLTKKKSPKGLEELLRELERCVPRPSFQYKEPSDLPGIEAERPKEPEKIQIDVSDRELNDKILGGWLGRCAGCLLGKPVEGLKKEQIEEWLKVADAYPLSNYFPSLLISPKNVPEWLRERVKRLEKRRLGVLLGRISRMARDDDIDYTIMGLHILETYSANFTTIDVGESWLSLLPYWQVYTAERIAYRNLINGIVPPETATFMNPYREWIGAQIRGDMWGYVSPGIPHFGADLAHRDAGLSHVKNGMYGEMLASSMISAAFATNKIEDIIGAGLSVIPKDSRLAEAIRDVVTWSTEDYNWEDSWRKVMDKYGHYHPVHTINNAAVLLLGLIYGRGDFEKSITLSVMGGLDTDCNGATTGSILGVMLGAETLPDKWTTPLNDQVESFVIGYNNSRISKLARRTAKHAKRILRTSE